MTLVKICGVRSPEDALAIAGAGADLIGLMFAESRRQVSLEQAREIISAVRPDRRAFSLDPGGPPGGWFERCQAAIRVALDGSRPLLGGVFADQPLEEVQAIAGALALDFVQLSGGEPWEWAPSLPCPVIKVLHVASDSSADSLIAAVVPGTAAVCMLDTGRAGWRGGTGERFDWAVAAEVDRVLPVALAGGLDPENIGEALTRVGPWLVDVSTGVETDGAKDLDKVRRFIQAAKNRQGVPA
jgi:anthranilate synthase/indole-3-glycerol phosphate synthase/phosphoribosylanthranilate isomerase